MRKISPKRVDIMYALDMDILYNNLLALFRKKLLDYT